MNSKCPNCGVNDVKIIRITVKNKDQLRYYCEACFGNEDNYGTQPQTVGSLRAV